MIRRYKVFRLFSVFLCANLFAAEECTEDWREWTLLVPAKEKRAFISGVRPPAYSKPVLAGKISPKARTLATKWRQTSSRPLARKNYENREAWEKQISDAYEFIYGWTLPFKDYCRKSGNRNYFATRDIWLKSELAISLMEESVGTSDKCSREYWEMGASLFSELLGEFCPGHVHALETRINKTEEKFEKQTQNVFLARARFEYYRQRELQNIFKFGHITHTFLAGLRRFFKDDYNAQLRKCAEVGLRGKIDLAKFGCPELSEEAISRVEN